jgi:hypothetical protein
MYTNWVLQVVLVTEPSTWTLVANFSCLLKVGESGGFL